MPMLDACIPEGALTPEAERKLLGTCTDLLLEHEGARPTNERARSLAWVFVHRHETYVAGAPAEAPHGTWGGLGGRVVTLPDIAEFVIGKAGRRYGEERLAERRREQARALLEAAQAKQSARA